MHFSQKLANVTRSQYENHQDISTEGLIGLLIDWLHSKPTGRTLKKSLDGNDLSRIAEILEKTLADRDWVTKRYIGTPVPVGNASEWAPLVVNDTVNSIDGIVKHVSTHVRAYRQSCRDKVIDLKTTLDKIDVDIRKIVTEDTDEDVVNKAVDKVTSTFRSKFKSTMRSIKVPSPLAPGGRIIVRDSHGFTGRVSLPKQEPSALQAPTVDEIVSAARWMADTIDTPAYDLGAYELGFDTDDDPDFTDLFSVYFEDAYDEYYGEFYYQNFWDDFEALEDWYRHEEFCRFLVRHLMRFVKD